MSGRTRRGTRREAGRSARRIGVVDVGSNSVRLVVYEALSRSPAFFFNEKVLCGLGADLVRTGRLSPEGRVRALAALARFASLAERMDVDVLDGVATAAVRDAEDGGAFRAEVKRVTGLDLRVASGADEARLAAQGVLLGWPDADGLVADLGGASLELAPVGMGEVGEGRTFPLGPLRLAGIGDPERIDAAIEEALEGAADLIAPQGRRLYLVGGAWRALAKIHMQRTDYPIKVLHEFALPGDEMLALAEGVAEETPEDLACVATSSAARLAVTPLGARVLAHLLRAARPSVAAVSAYGLREGVLFEHLPPSLRAQDPLLSGAREMERRLARFPGFGEELAAWVWPLFPGAPLARRRLIEAACILNDVSWNSHPDYRDEACFETVFRANITGLGHVDRAFIGAALRYRYKAQRRKREDLPVLSLLSEENRAEARMLGRAIRLGAMLSGSAPGALPSTRLSLTPETLTLTLTGSAAALAGEVVEKRLAALAESVGREPVTEIESAADEGQAPGV